MGPECGGGGLRERGIGLSGFSAGGGLRGAARAGRCSVGFRDLRGVVPNEVKVLGGING